jgi:hypothetical protein
MVGPVMVWFIVLIVYLNYISCGQVGSGSLLLILLVYIHRRLILGHSFVRRLGSDLHARLDEQAAKIFDLQGMAKIFMHDVGRSNSPKIKKDGYGVITRISPDIVILDIRTNDLALSPPEVVGSDIEELVRSLVTEYSVRAVVWCQVTPRAAN